MGKIGRNDPCPCGSGKKYKRCCIDREDDLDFINPSNFFQNYKKARRETKIKQCLHPLKDECSEKIIGAHSIQNNKILKQISDNGHVYMPYPKDDNPFAIITKWGRKEATVFSGFCGYHDNELFKPIENYEFNKSDEHIFLYTYRAFALGYHRKQESINFHRYMLRKRPSLIGDNDIYNLINGVELAINDLEGCKQVFDKAILNSKYDVLTSIIWEFNKPIKFAASGHTALCKDLRGKIIQDILDPDAIMKHIFFAIFPEGEKSYCIISWLKDNNDIFMDYRSQLLELTEEERKIYLNNLIPMEAENIVINPTSWDRLEKHQKDDFGMLMWGMGVMYELMCEENYNMLEPTLFDLFEL